MGKDTGRKARNGPRIGRQRSVADATGTLQRVARSTAVDRRLWAKDRRTAAGYRPKPHCSVPARPGGLCPATPRRRAQTRSPAVPSLKARGSLLRALSACPALRRGATEPTGARQRRQALSGSGPDSRRALDGLRRVGRAGPTRAFFTCGAAGGLPTRAHGTSRRRVATACLCGHFSNAHSSSCDVLRLCLVAGDAWSDPKISRQKVTSEER